MEVAQAPNMSMTAAQLAEAQSSDATSEKRAAADADRLQGEAKRTCLPDVATASTATQASQARRMVADDGSRIAVGLIRGVARLPKGPERAEECCQRRLEIRSGLHRVQLALRRLEEEPSPNSQADVELVWASHMLNGSHTATRTLQTLDNCDTPVEEYESLLRLISGLRTRLAALSAAATRWCAEEAAPQALAAAARAGRSESVRRSSSSKSTSARKVHSMAVGGALTGLFRRFCCDELIAKPGEHLKTQKQEAASYCSSASTASSAGLSDAHCTGDEMSDTEVSPNVHCL